MKAKIGLLAAAVSFCIGMTATAVSAQGSQLRISGTKVVFSAKDKASSITLFSGETAPLAFQVRAFRWEQQGDRDVLTPTDDITVSPPLGTIEPGKSQTVRVVLRNNDRTREQTYRILIDEVPPATAQPADRRTNVAVNFRLSVPVFAATRQPSASDVQWSFSSERGMYFVQADNRGAEHAMVGSLAVRSPNGENVETRSLGLPYVLSGATRRWRIIPPSAGWKAGDTLIISSQVDGAVSEHQVTVSAAP